MCKEIVNSISETETEVSSFSETGNDVCSFSETETDIISVSKTETDVTSVSETETDVSIVSETGNAVSSGSETETDVSSVSAMLWVKSNLTSVGDLAALFRKPHLYYMHYSTALNHIAQYCIVGFSTVLQCT